MPDDGRSRRVSVSHNSRDQRRDVTLRPYRPGDEPGIVRVLQTCHPETWGKWDASHWQWKHPNRPNFNPNDIIVATDGDRIVGCFHGAVLPVQIEPGLTLPVSFDGDYAVDPDYRGLDITGRAYDVSDPQLLARGVVLRGGFTSRALNEKFYRKRFGYSFVPTAQIELRKIIGLFPLKAKFARLGTRLLSREKLRQALGPQGLVVNLVIDGLPPAHLVADREAFDLREGFAERFDLRLTIPYRVLADFDEPRRLAAGALTAMLTGRMRARGLLGNGQRLIKIALALLPLLSAKGRTPPSGVTE